MGTPTILYYVYPSMIFKKGDIKIGMIATSPPRGRTVKIVNVYTSCPLFPSLQVLQETTIALAQITGQREGTAPCFCPQASAGWETVHQALP